MRLTGEERRNSDGAEKRGLEKRRDKRRGMGGDRRGEERRGEERMGGDGRGEAWYRDGGKRLETRLTKEERKVLQQR